MQTSSHKSVLTGSQRPRIEHHPLFITTRGEDVCDLAFLAGMRLDPWQEHVLKVTLGETEDGKWASPQCGLIVSRQNGKNFILEARELAGLFLFNEKLIIHTAHNFSTAHEAFESLRDRIVGCKDLLEEIRGYNPEIDGQLTPGFKRSHGAESIIHKSGHKIAYGTRTGLGGRGKTADLLILDEAFALTDAQMGALLPTISSKSQSGKYQVWYTSSAGNSTSNPLRRIRNTAIEQKADTLAYCEWSAPEDADIFDENAWRQANPALGMRISYNAIREELYAMSGEQFKRERLGIWGDTDEEETIIEDETWNSLASDNEQLDGKVIFAIDVTPQRDISCIVAGSKTLSNKTLIEIVDIQTGTSEVVPKILELTRKHPNSEVMIEASSGASVFIPELKRNRVRFRQITARDYAQGCSLFFDMVQNKTLTHTGQEQLLEAIQGAKVRILGDSLWKWVRKNTLINISPLVASTIACLGVERIIGVRQEVKEKRKIRIY